MNPFKGYDKKRCAFEVARGRYDVMECENGTIDGILLDHCAAHVRVGFDEPHQVLSSAVLNGGLLEADHILNLKVADHENVDSAALASPELTLREYCTGKWDGTVVGMMTAAPMNSMRCVTDAIDDVNVAVIATSGLSNPRRAGDRADSRELYREVTEVGTINVIVVTDASLSHSAMVETIMVASEAKAAALQDLNVLSPVSGLIATGTGTDAMALACRMGDNRIRYAGKHVVFGETVAKLVIKAVSDSLSACPG